MAGHGGLGSDANLACDRDGGVGAERGAFVIYDDHEGLLAGRHQVFGPLTI